MEVSSAPDLASAFMDWNVTSPGAGISRSPGGVLAGIGVVSEERGDLRKRLRILDELDVIVIACDFLPKSRGKVVIRCAKW
jgi:hypothetical protein